MKLCVEQLGSRIVFGWVKGGCKPQATSPKRRLAPSTNHSHFLAKKSNPFNPAEMRARIDLELPWRVSEREWVAQLS